jgi:hypothetical protein
MNEQQAERLIGTMESIASSLFAIEKLMKSMDKGQDETNLRLREIGGDLMIIHEKMPEMK